MKKIKLLYAEDDQTIRQGHLAYIKSRFDLECYEAKDGAEALALYHEHQPEIVLADIEMPFMSGLELAAEIRKLSKFTKIVIISAHADTQNLLDALNLYLVNFIVKPISKSRLNESIQIALDTMESVLNHDKYYVRIGETGRFDLLTHEYILDGERVRLSNSEAKLLAKFIKNKNQSLSSMDIFIAVWDDIEKEYSSDAVRTLVKKLRKKLPDDTIENIYGGFYRFNT